MNDEIEFDKYDDTIMEAVFRLLRHKEYRVLDVGDDRESSFNFVACDGDELVFVNLIVMPEDSKDFGPRDNIDYVTAIDMIALYANSYTSVEAVSLRYDVIRVIPVKGNDDAMVRHEIGVCKYGIERKR